MDDKWGKQMRDKRQICGTCKYHHHEDIDDGWVCVNDDSEYVENGRSTWTNAMNGRVENEEL